ncbi:hypothetical protein G7Z17_g13128 [Cylindrodendrum hubeiense]|uniref:GRF-type domain-containing protein n=1 Tax=Cylindrodendrum hubeiense TaxID=595255 RepID=A0A9P5L8J6_9HYPO|nr:hypothetical protein G7Z17_g13128 [Cylindrodendrum hubeiense]
MPTEPHRRFRPPRQKQQQREPQTPTSHKKRLNKGIFSDGVWLCNCEPRKELTLRETKKQGPNQGKFFYKCFDCGLFLWRDTAKARETGLTPSKVPAQPPRPKTPSLTQQPLTAYGYQRTPGGNQSDAEAQFATDSDEDLVPGDARGPAPAPAPEPAGMQTPCPPSSKRKRDVFEEDEFSDMESDEERQMVEMADQSAEKLQAQRSFATPSNTRSTDIIAGLPTPSIARTLFPAPTSENKRQKQVTFEDPARWHHPRAAP